MRELVRRAEVSEEEGRTEEALDLWRRVVAIDESYVYLVRLGRAAWQAGQLDEAERTLRRAIESQSSNADARVKLGLLYRDQNRLEEAAVELGKALAIEDDAAPAVLLGNTLDALGRKREACAAFEQALALEPDNEEAVYGLGLAIRFEDPERAARLFRRAIDVVPAFGAAHRELGFRLWRLGDLDAAEDSLRTALAHDRNDAWAHDYLAHVFLSRGDLEAAERELRAAIRAAPGRASISLNLATFSQQSAARTRPSGPTWQRYASTARMQRQAHASACS